MTQEEKQLLLKDLCTRLPYGVIVWYNNQEKSGLVKLGCGNIGYVETLGNGWWKECKPFLRPISSMTDEEREELEHLSEEYFGKALDKQIQESLSSSNRNESRIIEYIASSKIVDWLNSRNFDYHGLIEKGLALEAPEGMYKID